LATQTILAKRIIEMADQGLRDIPALRDDALAFLQHSPPSASRNGLGEAIKAQAAALAELENKAIETASMRLNAPSSRFTASAFGFFIFNQSGERPER